MTVTSPLATVTDLQKALLRDLTAAESQASAWYLSRAESLLLAKVPNLLTRSTIDEHFAILIRGVEAEMVARVFRNPEGIKREDQGNYSYQVDHQVASGRLFVSDDDLDALGLLNAIVTAASSMDGYAARVYGNVDSRMQYGWPGA